MTVNFWPIVILSEIHLKKIFKIKTVKGEWSDLWLNKNDWNMSLKTYQTGKWRIHEMYLNKIRKINLSKIFILQSEFLISSRPVESVENFSTFRDQLSWSPWLRP